MDGVLEHVEQVLSRGHALFGRPSTAGAQLGDGGQGLVGVTDRLRRAQSQMGALTGVVTAHYDRWVKDAVRAMDATSGTDAVLRDGVRAAGHANGSGWATSAAVAQGAAADTAGLAPTVHTPGGQRALIAALRARLAQQQHLIEAYQARDVRLAAVVRSLRYAQRGGVAAIPLGAMPLGTRASGGPGAALLSGLSGLAGTGGRAGGNHRGVLADWRGDPHTVGIDPGLNASKAALGKLGCPYVWGAKGPGRFDCSGLTQWAWRQAGVALGADTYAQIKEGIAVPAGQVRPGDLIFPLDSFGRAGPGHVQLAISDRQVVHAPTPGDVVRIAAMPARYIARRPLRTTTP